jgi:hypothetical protein
LEELVSFINDKRKDVQLVALENVAAQSSNIQNHKILKNTKIIRFLARLIGENDIKILQAVVPTLINLSEDPFFVKQMISLNIISRVVDSILDSKNVPKLYIILLCNLTRDERGARKLLQIGDPLFGYYVSKLITCFCERDPKVADQHKDEYQWISNVLINITQLNEGRDLIMDKSRNFFSTLLKYVNHPNHIRRRGIIGVIRNCLFNNKFHNYLMDEVDILSILLEPLRGPEVFPPDELEGMPERLKHVSLDKERDNDLECRQMLVDCLLLLTSNLHGRELMRKKRVYEIVREYDKVEKDELTNERIYNIITLLKGLDEPKNIKVNTNPIDIMSQTNFIPLPKIDETQNEPENIKDIVKEILPEIEYDEIGEQIEII